MKVLWFEVTEPLNYSSEGAPIGGWQDSLERVVRSVPEIELTICFLSSRYLEEKVIDGVRYVPIYIRLSYPERLFHNYWDVYVKKIIPKIKRIVEDNKPDLIHVFGTEWLFGQVASYTDVPVVIHIMGAIIPYNNANYPPGYSYETQIMQNRWHFLYRFKLMRSKRFYDNWQYHELEIWRSVGIFMGRTHWDESLSRTLHPGRRYYHVDEAIRSEFLKGDQRWKLPNDGRLRLVTVGCKTFWKGPDMILKVAKILEELKVDFEWLVAGEIDTVVKKTIERKECSHFEDFHVKFLGYKQPTDLIRILCSSTMYVHTAYIDNSPNSICEAQCLGVPVVSTNVGGISSLVHNNVSGILVAANDPWKMADEIVELSKDKERMQLYSGNARKTALCRHDDNIIKRQLLDCYQSIISDKTP